MRFPPYFLLYLVVLLAVCCRQAGKQEPVFPFSDSPETVPVKHGLNEISGIADSWNNEDCLWAEEDGGNPTALHLLKHDGSYVKKIHLKGMVNRDWEDIALTPAQGNLAATIYLADIGDNSLNHGEYNIYRFAEPGKAADTITSFEKIVFKYPDGAHDAEAMFVDPLSRHIYIVTKRDAESILYRISAPQSLNTVNIAERILVFPFSGAVSAAISPDNKEVIVKTYTHLYYWAQKTSGSVEVLLKQSPQMLPYIMEPQGEAICFKKDNSGFFTLSEKGLAVSVLLNFYKRK